MASRDEILAALRLINTYRIGPSAFYALVNDCNGLINAAETAEKHGKHQLWPLEKATQEFNKAKSLEIELLLYLDDDYPQMLKNLPNPPPIIYAKGNLDALNMAKSVGIVGSRAASINGRKTAAKIACNLAEKDVCIISGMAKGIDSSAHKGAMYAKDGCGVTVAVLGTGLDIIYPEENKDLFAQICTNGCVISEMPLGTLASARQFPRRNRIIAALSEAVVVVEAGLKSGSLITAEFAKEQGKLLFAVPGAPTESRAQGANHLIKEGARLVEEANDILPFLKGNKFAAGPKKTTTKQKVLVFENNNDNLSKQKNKPQNWIDFLTVDGTDIDEIIRMSGKDAQIIAAEISELELSGVVKRCPGNKIALIKQD